MSDMASYPPSPPLGNVVTVGYERRVSSSIWLLQLGWAAAGGGVDSGVGGGGVFKVPTWTQNAGTYPT
jgi:hypothetical protein